MSIAIKAENISKKYIIGHQRNERYATVRDMMMHQLRSLKQRLRHPLSMNKEETDVEEFWALQDINFEIKTGDRVGIIGRNGAGKSTLLKVLSRITDPSSGRITIQGRVASLLEVGTGFHPELTGRENIFLNGAILGMRKNEIKQKFDEIVDFAEVEKFLDTPVKRYSSGMYIRLAFAVAAHLEPEILVVDEVLAVGDAQFQNKCLNKMKEAGDEGRTILFVSHNMNAILQLTKRTIVLNKGHLFSDSTSEEAVGAYLNTNNQPYSSGRITTQDNDVEINNFSYIDDSQAHNFNSPLKLRLDALLKRNIHDIYIMVTFTNSIGAKLLTTKARIDMLPKGKQTLSMVIENHRLVPGNYTLSLYLSLNNDLIFSEENIIAVEVIANCDNEPLLIPHITRAKDKIGAFCPINITISTI